MRWIWPLLNTPPMFPDEPGRHGAFRSLDRHTGVDFYCKQGTQVVAVEDGEVVHIEGFTGPNADDPSPWWNDTLAILIEGASGVVNYGEVTPLVKVGDKVKVGQVIAVIDTAVLKKFKGRPMMMLHLELMVPGARKTVWWRLDDPQPDILLDPTDKLREAAGETLQHFDLAAYDGVSFRPVEVIQASVVVLHCGDRVLMLHRGPEDRSYPNGWCFPGGTCDDGEDPMQAAIRELREETGMEIPFLVSNSWKESNLPSRNRRYVIHIFNADVPWQEEFRRLQLSDEHQGYGWFLPSEALALPPAGPVTKSILEELL